MSRSAGLLALLFVACAYDGLGPDGRRIDEFEGEEEDGGSEEPDAGTDDPDAGPGDAGTADAGPGDAGTADAGTPDAGDCAGGRRRVTESWIQAAAPATDVLLVVDDSGSMAEEQGLLGDAATSFIGELTRLGAPFQVGVITTDVDAATKSGLLRTVPRDASLRFVVPGGSAAADLGAMVRAVGVNGSGTERGLEAMRLALTPPRVSDPLKNGGFRRTGVRLAVVVLSDEEDNSPLTENEYARLVTQEFATAETARFSALVGLAPSGCSSANGDAAAGLRYLALVTSVGGVARSICTSSYETPMAEIARDAVAANVRFTLASEHTDSDPTVTVGGETLSRSGWTWSGARDLVLTVPPSAGAKVEIAYDAPCP